MNATFTPSNVHYLPPLHSADARLDDAWRIARADVAEDMFWINQYERYLMHGAMTPSYRRYVETAVAGRCRSYRAGLRRVAEIEEQIAQRSA